MQFELKILQSSLHFPLPLTRFLNAHRDTEFRAEEYARHHPIAIYGQSIVRVADALRRAMDAFREFENGPADGEEKHRRQSKLLEEIERIFAVGTEHFDDVKSVVFLFAQLLPTGQRKKLLSEFDATVRDAREFFSIPANEMKHRQSRARLLFAKSATEVCYGFFFDGIDENGAFGPSPIVHVGGKSAFSYGRIVRQAAQSVLFTSRAAAHLLNGKFRKDSEVSGLGVLLSNVQELCDWAPKVIFWDELAVCPTIRLNETGFELTTNSRKSDLHAPTGEYRMEVEYGGNGMTKVFNLPYAGTPTKPGPKRAHFARTR